MSRLAQKTRTETTTENQSMTLVRNILRTTISSIAYLRYLFPEENFYDRSIAGINIKSLQPLGNSEAKQLCDWLEYGVFDALSKKFLRTIIFGIYLDPNRENEMIECYTFSISYPNEKSIELNLENQSKNGIIEKKLKFQTKEEIKQAWVSVIRTIVQLSQTLSPIPENRFITMKLLYYDEITPPDYEPKFFQNSQKDFFFLSKPLDLKLGSKILTPFHSLDLRIKTSIDSEDKRFLIKEKEELNEELNEEKGNNQFFSVIDEDNDLISKEESLIDQKGESLINFFPKLKKKIKDWDFVSTSKICEEFKLEKKFVKKLIQKLKEEKLISSKYNRSKKGWEIKKRKKKRKKNLNENLNENELNLTRKRNRIRTKSSIVDKPLVLKRK
ncbi:horma domain-containing protein [Anaeramoeba ignava]|uniref:Horma domain-containing protein n=1 Tax=Anaeramoeba ignava TaxID=1746090 RepID=A0A9Q0L733_ANAIG|nr:horma domain-containing protein [Anaeramoeba ignava]